MVSDNPSSNKWYQQTIVRRLIEAEKKELSNMLPKLHGYHLVLLGESDFIPLLEASLISHRVIINLNIENHPSAICASSESLPLRTDSIDVMVLAHTLEHAANPHEVLRETHRALISEGYVLITGLNPWSMWGIWHTYKKLAGKIASQSKMLSLNRLRDWLKLLNFQIMMEKRFYFRLPIESGYHKMDFLEKGGEKCWPFFAGAYAILAVKRVIPLTLTRARVISKKRLWQGELPNPTISSFEENNG